MGNGCYGAWAVSGVVFRNVRVHGTHCQGVDGRAPPSSGALVFGGGSEGTPPHAVASKGNRILNATYTGLCKRNLVWPATAWSATEMREAAFAPRPALDLTFCFDDVGAAAVTR